MRPSAPEKIQEDPVDDTHCMSCSPRQRSVLEGSQNLDLILNPFIVTLKAIALFTGENLMEYSVSKKQHKKKKSKDLSLSSEDSSSQKDSSRRDFLILATGAMGALGIGSALWPFVDSMNPADDVRSSATVDVDLSRISVGQAKTILWQGKPVFIRHRSGEEIRKVRAIKLQNLLDPEKDENRVQKPEWLVVIGICTHLGCVPAGQKPGDNKGTFEGWFCPCHGSEYDLSGRVCRGPAPKNLSVPEYHFLDEKTLRIGPIEA